MSNSNTPGTTSITPSHGRTPLQTKLSETRSALLNTAWVSLLLLGAGFFAAESHPDTALFLVVGFVFLGLYVFVGTLETTLLRNLVGLRASLVGWVTIIAYFAWVAKSRAIGEINEIFHVDPSLLPMTVIAVTVLQVMSMLFWPVVIISVLLVGIAYWWRQDFAGSNDGIVILLTLIMSVVAQLFFAGLVWGWVESSNQKTATIYRIAHFADFNSSFRCAGLDEAKVRVLFVNPDRSQVITAPKIANVSLYSTAKATWLQPVAIPEEFPQVSCAPQPKRTTPSNEVLTLPQ